jgi:nucleotide-binding universal stress UspA family protein
MSSSSYKNRSTTIVGVDEKESSDMAVVAAYQLAVPLKLEIELLHASPVPFDFFAHVDPLGVERARAAAAERWKGLLEAHGIVGVDLARTLSIVPGRSADAILARAEESEASLIVLGRHRRRAPLDFGDVVRSVVSQASCPVWVQAGPWRPIRKVLCAIDLAPSAMAVLALARDVARALGAELVSLHCFVRPQLGFVLGYPVSFPPSVVDAARETDEREYRRMLEPFDWHGVLHRQLFYEADPASELVSIQSEFDLVVLGTHGRTGIGRALVGSVASELLRRSNVPVLVTRVPA